MLPHIVLLVSFTHVQSCAIIDHSCVYLSSIIAFIASIQSALTSMKSAHATVYAASHLTAVSAYPEPLCAQIIYTLACSSVRNMTPCTVYTCYVWSDRLSNGKVCTIVSTLPSRLIDQIKHATFCKLCICWCWCHSIRVSITRTHHTYPTTEIGRGLVDPQW